MGNNKVMIKWNPIKIPQVIATMFQKPFTVDILLHSLNPQTNTHSFMMNLATNIPNNGSFEVTLPYINDQYMAAALSVSVSENSISEFLNDDNRDNTTKRDASNQDDKSTREIVEDIINNVKNFRKVRKFLKNPTTLFKNPASLIEGAIKNTLHGIALDAARRILCEAYCALEPDNIGNEINQQLPSCPPTSNRARRDRRFTRENPIFEYFTVGSIGQCFTQSVFDR